MEEVALAIFVLILILLWSCMIYMLPTIIACLKKRKNRCSIGVLNLLLGWTLVGWAVSLVWAVKEENVL